MARHFLPTEMQKILFFYDGLGLSADLIEYLIEYCVSRNHKSIRYIETVATCLDSGRHHFCRGSQEVRLPAITKNIFLFSKHWASPTVIPVETEITLMDTWLKTYGFSIEIIQEACNRTVLQTGQASFQYADKILEGWKKKEVQNPGGHPVLWMTSIRTAASLQRKTAASRPDPADLLPVTASIISNSENTILTNMKSIF